MITDTIHSRVANALFDVRPARMSRLAQPSIALARAMYKGLWVGGRVTITRTEYHFHPNAMNRVAHTGTIDFVVPLVDITDVSTKWGVVSSLVIVQAAGQELRIRCFGARGFADRLRAAVAAARGATDARGA